MLSPDIAQTIVVTCLGLGIIAILQDSIRWKLKKQIG
jgi:hypothetical protein